MDSPGKSLRPRYFVVAYLVLAVLFGGMIYRFGGAKNFRRLAHGGLPAKATIEWTQCENHGRYLYVFAIDGQRYSGFSNGHTEKPCRALRKGDELDVVYLPADPSINADGDPAARYSNELISTTVVTLVLPGLLVFGLFRALADIEEEDRKFFRGRSGPA